MPIAFSIVIPALNEKQIIERAVRETARVFASYGKTFEMIVVDDGSTDGTSQVVEALGREGLSVRLLRHAANQGKGAAVRTGVLTAIGEWILILDADLSVTPDAFTSFLPALETSDIIIGSRRVAGAILALPQPLLRDLSGRCFNVFIRVLLRLPYRDTQCGFKAFHQRTRMVFDALETTGWSFDVELLVRARRASFRIIELPVTWSHGEISRVRFSHGGSILKELLRIRRIH